jgi:phenylacetate-CoA oxygenase PaaJ subunit
VSNKAISAAYATRLGDNALVLGQRMIELVAASPELEEELANANFSLDYIGQARMFYTYAGECEGAGRTEDDFAFLRPENEYRNLLLVEQPNGHFGDSTVRAVLFESWYVLLLDALTRCADDGIAAIAERAIKEVRYHVRHSSPSPERCSLPMNSISKCVSRCMDRISRRSRRNGERMWLPSSQRQGSNCPATSGWRAVASRANIPNTSAFYWRKCNTCNALTRGQSGRDRVRVGPDSRVAVAGAGSRDPGADDYRSRHCAGRGCPATEAIEASVVAALEDRGVSDVRIKRVLSPAWTTDWISEDGRKKLRVYGIAPPERRDRPVACPRCDSSNTEVVSEFGSTACKASYRCVDCLEPFEYFKCL